MAHGRKTGGRKKGTPNKVPSAKRQAIMESGGDLPLDYMLRVMRDARADTERRDDMAKAAAPYLHPKLAAVEHTGKDGGPIESVTRIELVPVTADGNGSGPAS